MAALLDAHPNALIAHGVDVFEERDGTVEPAFADRLELFGAIAHKSEKRAARTPDPEKGKRLYSVSDQHPGRADNLQVVGTRRARGIVAALDADPGALADVERRLGVPLKLVHLIRDPYAEIVAGARGKRKRLNTSEYIRESRQVAGLRQEGADLLDVFVEDLVDNPTGELARLCRFLGLSAGEDYLQACASIVAESPQKPLEPPVWVPEEVEAVQELIRETPWLERYAAHQPAPVAEVRSRKAGPPDEDADAGTRAAAVTGEGDSDPEAAGAKAGGQSPSISVPVGDLTSFCLFVGPNRSGTSVVGALLDAHPNALIAHELDVFEDRGRTGQLRFPNREELFAAIARNSARMAARGRPGRRRRQDVSYEVPGQHQGEATGLRVIGTKRAQRTMAALERNPRALAELRDQVRLPLKLVLVVRNPYDNVASMTPLSNRQLNVAQYRRFTRQVAEIRQEGWDLVEVVLEDLIADPHAELRRVCEFFALPADHEYLQACAAILLERPNESRNAREWRPADIETVRELIDTVPWLGRYQGCPPPSPPDSALLANG